MDILMIGLMFGGFFFVQGCRTTLRAIMWSILYVGLVGLMWIGFKLGV